VIVGPEIEAALAKAAQSLRFRAPEDWDAFIKALSDRVDAAYDQCVSAPPDRVLMAQGRAQEARDILKTLLNAPQLAAQLHDQARKLNHGRKP
jgi:hypothetical protein